MDKIIDRIFELYLIQNTHYLVQFRGGYYTTRNDRSKPLRKYLLKEHLEGKRTVGTFAGQYFTKFLTFDIDYRNQDVARWVTYKIAKSLDDTGVREYAISFSGNKGYHVDIFLDKAISIDAARRFFDLVVKLSEVDVVEGGEVEFRPSGLQGVKLPLGTHQKTGNYCGFCEVSDGLRVKSPEESEAYFLALKKADHMLILGAFDDDTAYDSRDASDMEEAVARHKPLETYDQSESYTLSRAAERYHNGLTGPGQRHKSFLLLAQLFNHNGVDKTEAYTAITDWFAWQNADFYDSDAEFCACDLQECVDYVYEKNLTLTIEQRDLTVAFGEIDGIMRKCPQKNQKALAYALLVHSKRWGGGGGTFYMTYAQMGATAGTDERTARRQVDKLQELGVIEIVHRDQRRKGTYKKKPNVYRMTLESGGREYGVGGDLDINECLAFFYTEVELRRLLPRRQFQSFVNSRDTDIPA
ncbi:hypothetical protein B4V02_09095 [Paenibacillus kribbensis]|uniref:TOTE conflict system primase domain-containing protein n=1 Tax=Paenibacillus kribbensis TaxID=172713 RepID=A0A222WLJ3_9BACL|nr:winged helix-turn-helix domain-containing protein [Paenibacillus kribbensis]ASR46824.1 hypothetical protein B4V02_09095 [Paenibacillus kribbensis]